jgi:hypothetical protein
MKSTDSALQFTLRHKIPVMLATLCSLYRQTQPYHFQHLLFNAQGRHRLIHFQHLVDIAQLGEALGITDSPIPQLSIRQGHFGKTRAQ